MFLLSLNVTKKIQYNLKVYLDFEQFLLLYLEMQCNVKLFNTFYSGLQYNSIINAHILSVCPQVGVT